MAKRKPTAAEKQPRPPPKRPPSKKGVGQGVGGGPKIPDVDPNVVEGMAAIGCRKTDIARVVGISVDTLDRRFAEVFDKGQANRNLRLYQALWRSAIDHNNIVAQIWLSKQYLGMTEKQEITQKTALRTFGPEIVERARKALKALEAGTKDRVCDLHIWSIGPGIYAAEISLVTTRPREPEYYARLLPKHLGIMHPTFQVHRCRRLARR